jgi:hypothetical protein|tara:strand:- start:310 stop:573 length:264 start_codon:yes stop_codon:yes gene_type:complete
MNEGEYLEMVNQLKVKFDSIEKSNQKMRIENLELKKIVWSCYGILRIVDITYNCDSDFTHMLIETLRGMLSDIFDEWFEISDDGTMV